MHRGGAGCAHARRRDAVAVVGWASACECLQQAVEGGARPHRPRRQGVVRHVVAAQIDGRSLGREKDQGCLDGLLLTPVDRSALYFGKLIGNFIFMIVVALVLLPLMSVLFDVNFFQPMIVVVLFMGVLGYAGVGTLIASMSAYTRGREVMLPILLLPIALSILIPAVRATRGLLEATAINELAGWFRLLGGTNVLYIALAYMLFDFVVEE